MTCYANIIILLMFSPFTSQKVYGASQDLTLNPGSYGVDVVRAVISKITFSNISFNHGSNRDLIAPFMRTMAYVETKDGAQLNYSNGGGIWNVSMLSFTYAKEQFQNQTIMMQLLDRSQTNHIGQLNWSNLIYDNLSIPLYSGLVVRILIHLNPQGLGDYCRYWNFLLKNRMGDEDQCNRDANNLANIENCTVDTDLVFLLDESGSIGMANFQQVKSFAYNFTSELLPDTTNTSKTASRVGIITFSSGVMEHIALNSSIGRNELLRQISQLPYQGKSTNTAAGLEVMRKQSWRNEVSVIRLAIVVTDGRSNVPSQTELAAQAVHNNIPSIAVFAIGVGEGINETELRIIASRAETFNHLNSFNSSSLPSVGQGYVYQICFTESQDTTTSELKDGSLIRHATIRLRFTVPVDEGLTFRLCISEGRIIIYVSTIPNPSSAQYEQRDEVSSSETFPCLSIFREIPRDVNDKRKRRQALSDFINSASLYISREGQEDINMFSFNSSEGNVSLDTNECKEEPCDENAECFNTDGSFFCLCSKGYTGNGTFCFEDEKPFTTVEPSEDNIAFILSISLSVATISIGMIILVASLIFACHHTNARKKQTLNLEDKIQLTFNMDPDDNELEPYSPLELDVKMFSPQESDGIDAAMVEVVAVNPDGNESKFNENMTEIEPVGFVPTMVKKFEIMTADAKAEQKAMQCRSKPDKIPLSCDHDYNDEENESGITII